MLRASILDMSNVIPTDSHLPRMLAFGFSGAALVAYGLVAPGLLRKVSSLVVGAGLLYKAMNPPESPGETTVSFDARDTPFGNGKRDRVDEASWESFPASDPPAF